MKSSKFILSTLIAAAAMTSTAWADETASTTVAKIGDDGYSTVEGALSEVDSGETITIQSVEGSEVSTDLNFSKTGTFTITGNAPKYKLPIITVKNDNDKGNKTVLNIENANLAMAELDARQNATINVVNATIDGANGNDIVKSYFNGAINISGASTVDTMQVTTMGYITIDGANTEKKPELTATWQTNIYGNGIITVKDGAIFNTAALQLTGQYYEGRDNTDTGRVGKAAELLVDNATLNIGTNVYSAGGANYNYNSSKGINIGTVDGKSAVLNVVNYSEVTIKQEGNGVVTVGKDGTVNISDSTFTVGSRDANPVTLTNSGVITVDNSSFTAGSVTNNGTFTVSGNSTLNIGTLTGNAVQVIADATLSNSTVGGVVKVGFDAENVADTTLTLAGTTSIGTLYVGHEDRTNNYKLVVSGDDAKATLGNLYNRTDSVVTISNGATVDVGYWQSKGAVTIDAATVNHTGVNMYVYNNDSKSVATIALTNGARLTSDANYAIYLGNSEAGPAKGNAAITLASGSTLETKNLILHATGTVEEVSGAVAQTSVSAAGGSFITVSNAITMGKGSTLTVDSSTLTANTLTNNGTITVSGESLLQIANASGNAIRVSGGATLLDGTSVNGVNVVTMGTLTIDGTVTMGSGKYLYNYYEKDADGKNVWQKGTLTINGTLTGGNLQYYYADIKGEGTVDVYAAMFRGNTIYTDITAGNIYVYADAVFDGATVTQTLNNGEPLRIRGYGAKVINGGKLIANEGISIWVGDSQYPSNGSLEVAGTDSMVKAPTIAVTMADSALTIGAGASAEATTMTNVGTIAVNGGTLTAGTVTNNGTFSVSGNSTITVHGAVMTSGADAKLALVGTATDRVTATFDDGRVTVKDGASAEFKYADVTLGDGWSIHVGSDTTAGSLVVDSSTITGSVDGDGYVSTIVLNSAGSTATLKNGTIYKGNITNNGNLTIENSTLDVALDEREQSGVGEQSGVENYGTITVTGKSNLNAFFYPEAGGTLIFKNATVTGKVSGDQGKVRFFGTNVVNTFDMGSTTVYVGDTTSSGDSNLTLNASVAMGSLDIGAQGQSSVNVNEGKDLTIYKGLTIGENGVINIKQNATLDLDFGAATSVSGEMNIGGTFDNTRIGPQLGSEGDSGAFTVNEGGKVNVVEGGTFIADSVTNAGVIKVDGGTLSAGTITNNGMIMFDGNSRLESGVLTGVVTIAKDATLTVASSSLLADEGLKLTNNGTIAYTIRQSLTADISAGVEGSAVTLTASDDTKGVVVTSVVDITNSVDIPTAGVVLAAWSFDVALNGAEYVTVKMDVKKGLREDEIRILHKGNEENAGWTDVTEEIGSVSYDAKNGKLTFNAKSFSSYAAAANVPEPSAFGLLAGLGALALVAARRRRRK